MATYKLGEKVRIVVDRNGEPNFDRVCETAYKRALWEFGVDEDGHITKVPGSARSTDTVVLEFVKYQHRGGIGGQACVYEFVAWVERCEE